MLQTTYSLMAFLYFSLIIISLTMRENCHLWPKTFWFSYHFGYILANTDKYSELFMVEQSFISFWATKHAVKSVTNSVFVNPSRKRRHGSPYNQRARYGNFSPVPRPPELLPSQRPGRPESPTRCWWDQTIPQSPCSRTQHVWRTRKTCTLPYTHSLSQNIYPWTPPFTLETQTWIQIDHVALSVLEQPLRSGQKLHDVAWRSTIEVCNLRELWKHHKNDKQGADGVLVWFG